MGHIQSGASLTKATITTNYNSLRITPFPATLVGSYTLTANTVSAISAATAANTVLYTFKNTGSNYMVLRRISVGIQTTVLYTKGGTRLSCYFVRNSFTQGAGNGYIVPLTGNNVKKRTSTMATTTANVVIYNNAGITGDVATNEDTTPMATALFDLKNTVSTEPIAGMVNLVYLKTGDYPIVISPGEGFRIKNDAAFAAAGSSFLLVDIDYQEYTNF